MLFFTEEIGECSLRRAFAIALCASALSGSVGCTEAHDRDAGAASEGADAHSAPERCDAAAQICTDARAEDAGPQDGSADGDGAARDAGSADASADAGTPGGGAQDAALDAMPPGANDSGAHDSAAAHDSAQPSDAGTLSCAPGDCRDQPVPAIACANAPTLVTCDPGANGACKWQVRCDDSDAGTCGGLLGDVCGAGQFCNFETDAGGDGCVDIFDGQGVCAAQPSACTADYTPVCGCDFKSYSNRCAAHAAGVSVMHDGACSETECALAGGRSSPGNGASAPACRPGEDSYPLAGAMAAVCCVPSSALGAPPRP